MGSFIFTRCSMLKRGYWFLILLLVGACLEEPDCYQLNNNYVGIVFKKLFDGQADTLSIIGITAPSTDSVFYKGIRATGIQLELNPYDASTDFTISTTFGTNLLALGYASAIQFVSEDCGIRTILSELNINASDFDSLRIVNPGLTNPASTNIEVSRCPRTNIMKISFRKLVEGTEVRDTVELANVAIDYPVVYYFPAGKISTLNLPLNPASNTTTFTLEFTDGSVRTITAQYVRTQWDEYPRCTELPLFSELVNAGSSFSQVNPLRDSIYDPPLTNFAVFK
jgi:hypothetical protein